MEHATWSDVLARARIHTQACTHVNASSFGRRRQETISHIWFLLLNHVLLLDNLLQCLLCIAIIDLSRTCVTSLICYALVMFMIYFWIKIKLKVLIYLSI
jgi:hypothetical protein